jgi:hypothetical protein
LDQGARSERFNGGSLRRPDAAHLREKGVLFRLNTARVLRERGLLFPVLALEGVAFRDDGCELPGNRPPASAVVPAVTPK